MSGTSREDEFLLDTRREERGEASAAAAAGAALGFDDHHHRDDDVDVDDDEHQTIIDVIGGEVSNVVFPVAACIAITSALVQLLDPDGSSSSLGAGTWASAAYKEKVRIGFVFFDLANVFFSFQCFFFSLFLSTSTSTFFFYFLKYKPK